MAQLRGSLLFKIYCEAVRFHLLRTFTTKDVLFKFNHQNYIEIRAKSIGCRFRYSVESNIAYFLQVRCPPPPTHFLKLSRSTAEWDLRAIHSASGERRFQFGAEKKLCFPIFVSPAKLVSVGNFVVHYVFYYHGSLLYRHLLGKAPHFYPRWPFGRVMILLG